MTLIDTCIAANTREVDYYLLRETPYLNQPASPVRRQGAIRFEEVVMHGRSRLRVALAGWALLASAPAFAHCDGLDGPVVAAARAALDSGDPHPALIWVQPKDEAEIRRSLVEAIAVRKLGPQARELADRSFFETLVRVHRAGEGAAFSGLKPAGRDLGPAIPLADKAVESGSDRELAVFVAGEVERGIHDRFADLQRKRNFQSKDLVAGRSYVASYVTFIHYVEGVHEAAESKAAGHYVEESAPPQHHE